MRLLPLLFDLRRALSRRAPDHGVGGSLSRADLPARVRADLGVTAARDPFWGITRAGVRTRLPRGPGL